MKYSTSSFHKEEVLFISASELPEKVREKLPYCQCRFIWHSSQLEPSGNLDWGDTLKFSEIQNYFEDQKEKNHYDGSLDRFIDDYHLVIDYWLISTGFDFDQVKYIVFDTYD